MLVGDAYMLTLFYGVWHTETYVNSGCYKPRSWIRAGKLCLQCHVYTSVNQCVFQSGKVSQGYSYETLWCKQIGLAMTLCTLVSDQVGQCVY